MIVWQTCLKSQYLRDLEGIMKTKKSITIIVASIVLISIIAIGFKFKNNDPDIPLVVEGASTKPTNRHIEYNSQERAIIDYETYETYSNDLLRVDYPDSLIVDEEARGTLRFVEMKPAGENQFTPGVRVEIEDQSGLPAAERSSLDTINMNEAAEIFFLGTQPQNPKTQRITLSGNVPAIKYSAKGDLDGEPISGVIVSAVYRNNLVTLYLTGNQADEKFPRQIDRMISSLKFK